MISYSIYYVYDEGDRDYIDSHSDEREAYAERDRLRAQVAEDEDAEGVRVVVVKEES